MKNLSLEQYSKTGSKSKKYRGVERRKIYMDDDDRMQFLEILQKLRGLGVPRRRNN